MSELTEHFAWLKANWETRDSIQWQGIAVVMLYAHLDELISLQADAKRKDETCRTPANHEATNK